MAVEWDAIDLMRPHTSFGCPNELMSSLNRDIADSAAMPPIEGSPELRSAIADMLREKHFRSIDPNAEVTITAGSTQAIFCAMAASVGEGDEVIVIEPSFGTIADAIALTGARAVYMSLRPDYTVDWAEVQKNINPRTKLIALSSPHHASGVALGTDDWESLQKLVLGTKIRVLSDETLGDMVYPDSLSSSAAFSPRLAERSFVVGSLSKSLCVDGWRLGYCVAPVELTEQLRRVLTVVGGPTNHPAQLAFASYMAHRPGPGLFPYAQQLAEHRAMALEALEGSKFAPIVPQYGHSMVLDYSACSALADMELAERLIAQHGVAVLPMSCFMHDKQEHPHVRINLGIPRQQLAQALQRLSRVTSI